MLAFREILDREPTAPQDANVLLHSRREGNLLTVLPSHVRTRRSAMEPCQTLHSVTAEPALSLGRRLVASFVKITQGHLSILERVSPAMSIEDITTPEQVWMTRLHTRTDGLNR